MLEIGAVVGPRRQHDDGRVGDALGRDGAQLLEQHVRVVLDRRHLVPGEQFREEAHHHLAVFEHVRDARRHAQVVLQHVELARPGADDIDAGNVGIDAAGHVNALHHRPVLGVLQHLLGRDDAGLEYFLVVIDVVQEQVERPDPLAQARLQRPPFGRRDDARDDVERDQPLLAGFLAIDGEGDADAVEGEVGFGPLAGDALGRRRPQPFVVVPVMGTDAAVGVDHFVVEVHVGPLAEKSSSRGISSFRATRKRRSDRAIGGPPRTMAPQYGAHHFRMVHKQKARRIAPAGFALRIAGAIRRARRRRRCPGRRRCTSSPGSTCRRHARVRREPWWR